MEFLCKRTKQNEDKLNTLIEEVQKQNLNFGNLKEEVNQQLGNLNASLDSVNNLNESSSGNLDFKVYNLEKNLVYLEKKFKGSETKFENISNLINETSNETSNRILLLEGNEIIQNEQIATLIQQNDSDSAMLQIASMIDEKVEISKLNFEKSFEKRLIEFEMSIADT